MGDSLDRGHVATFSLWDDIDVNMMWLDSCYPTDESCSNPGVRRGMCQGGVDSSPKFVREKYPSAYVTFANVAFGEIGTTQSVYPEQNPSPTSAPTAAPSTASTSSAGFLSTSTPTTSTAGTTSNGGSCAGAWQQCGGQDFDGPTCCVSGYTCTVQNQWYSQCKWSFYEKHLNYLEFALGHPALKLNTCKELWRLPGDFLRNSSNFCIAIQYSCHKATTPAAIKPPSGISQLPFEMQSFPPTKGRTPAESHCTVQLKNVTATAHYVPGYSDLQQPVKSVKKQVP